MKKNIFLFWVLLYLPSSLFAQQSKIDSLLQVLKTLKEDTNKVKTLSLLGDELSNISPKKSIEYATLGLTLAKGLDFKKGISVCYNTLGNDYFTIGDNETALNDYNESYAIAFKMNDSLRMAAAYDNIGIIYFQQGNIDSALKLRNAAINIYKSFNNESQLANGYVWLGNIYSNKAQYTTALEYYLNALKILQKLNDPNTGFALVNIAYLYHTTKELDKAKKYALEAKEKFTKLNNQYGIIASLYNLSLIYVDEGDYNKAIESLFEAKKIAEQTDDKNSVLGIYNLLGDTFRQMQEYDSSIKYLNKALIIAKQINNVNQVANVIGNIGSVYEMQKKYSEALKYFLESMPMLDSLKDLINLRKNSKSLVEVYSYSNLPDSALKYFNLYQQLSDTIYNEQTTKSIADMDIKYETEKKEDSLKLQATNLLISNQKIATRNKLIGIIAIAFILTTGILFLLFNTYKRTRLAKDKIELLQRELHHRVKNNLAIVARLIEVAGRQLENNMPLKELENRIMSIAALHEKLYQQDNITTVNFNAVVKDIFSQINKSGIISKPVKEYIHSKVELNADKAIPLSLIINELLTNSYKYAFQETDDPFIEVNINQENERYIMHYKDNGKGLADVSEINNTHSYGVKLIKGLSSQLNGRYRFWNDAGLNFELIIPV